MKGNVITFRKDPIQIPDHFHSIREIFGRFIRIVAQYVHFHSQAPFRHPAADVSTAHNPYGLAIQGILADFQFCFIKIIYPGFMQHSHIPAAFQHQQQSRFRHRCAVGHRCIQGLDPIVMAGLHIQGIKSGTMADNDF